MDESVCLRCDFPLNEYEGEICDVCLDKETYWEPDGYDYEEDEE